MNFVGVPCRKMKPTQKHRPAIRETMLTAVKAMNDEYESKYFDFDWEGAREFSGALDEGRDPRVWRNPGGVRWADDPLDNPPKGRLVLWVLKKEANDG